MAAQNRDTVLQIKHFAYRNRDSAKNTMRGDLGLGVEVDMEVFTLFFFNLTVKY